MTETFVCEAPFCECVNGTIEDGRCTVCGHSWGDHTDMAHLHPFLKLNLLSSDQVASVTCVLCNAILVKKQMVNLEGVQRHLAPAHLKESHQTETRTFSLARSDRPLIAYLLFR